MTAILNEHELRWCAAVGRMQELAETVICCREAQGYAYPLNFSAAVALGIPKIDMSKEETLKYLEDTFLAAEGPERRARLEADAWSVER